MDEYSALSGPGIENQNPHVHAGAVIRLETIVKHALLIPPIGRHADPVLLSEIAAAAESAAGQVLQWAFDFSGVTSWQVEDDAGHDTG